MTDIRNHPNQDHEYVMFLHGGPREGKATTWLDELGDVEDVIEKIIEEIIEGDTHASVDLPCVGWSLSVLCRPRVYGRPDYWKRLCFVTDEGLVFEELQDIRWYEDEDGVMREEVER